MIVISGALVLVALVLLILGITVTDLNFVYASILVSLVSFVFLVIGILQRRGDKAEVPQPADSSAPVGAGAQSTAASTAVAGAASRTRGSVAVVDEQPAAGEDTDAVAAADDGDAHDDEEIDPADDRGVLVVAGRPRYHAMGCRYLIGKQAETIHLLDAREEGFTPCGVCKPDNVIALEDDIAVVPAEEGVEPVVDVDEPAGDTPAAEQTAALDTSVDAAPEQEPAAAGAVRGRRAAAKRGGSTVVETPTAAAAVAAGTRQTSSAGSAGRRSGTVVVIPDRGKYHVPECRYVRNAADSRTRTRTQAAKEGYVPCGVCKP